MEWALLKLHLKHHLLFGAILVGSWMLMSFLAGVSASETYSRYTCLSSDSRKYGFCWEEAQTSLGWFAGASTVVLTLLMLGIVITWIGHIPTRKDVITPQPKTELPTGPAGKFKLPRRLRIK